MAHPIHTPITRQVAQMSTNNLTSSPYLSDQLTAQFGKPHREHVMGKIGHKNRSYEELYFPYIESLAAPE